MDGPLGYLFFVWSAPSRRALTTVALTSPPPSELYVHPLSYGVLIFLYGHGCPLAPTKAIKLLACPVHRANYDVLIFGH